MRCVGCYPIDVDMRERRALGIAIGAHAALVAIASMSPPVFHALRTASPALREDAIEIVIVPPPVGIVAVPAHDAVIEAPLVARSRERVSASTDERAGARVRAKSRHPEKGELDPRQEVSSEPGIFGGEASEDWSAPSAYDSDAFIPFGLSLSGRVAAVGGFDAAPAAPTAPPARTKLTPEEVAESVRANVRHHDKKLGLGHPEQTVINDAIQVAGRATGVPNRTRFRVAVDVDGAGRVLGVKLVSASAGDDRTWGAFVGSVRSTLGGRLLPLGPDARKTGARVIVDALLLHAFPSGTDKQMVMGECPTLAVVRHASTLAVTFCVTPSRYRGLEWRFGYAKRNSRGGWLGGSTASSRRTATVSGRPGGHRPPRAGDRLLASPSRYSTKNTPRRSSVCAIGPGFPPGDLHEVALNW